MRTKYKIYQYLLAHKGKFEPFADIHSMKLIKVGDVVKHGKPDVFYRVDKIKTGHTKDGVLVPKLSLIKTSDNV